MKPISLTIKYPVKTKEIVYWQHFDLNNVMTETTTMQTVYHRKDGTHYVNYLEGTKTVKFEAGRYVAFGGRQIALTNGDDFIKMLNENRITSITMMP